MTAGAWFLSEKPQSRTHVMSGHARYRSWPYTTWDYREGYYPHTYAIGAWSRSGYRMGELFSQIKRSGGIIPTTAAHLTKTQHFDFNTFAAFGSNQNPSTKVIDLEAWFDELLPYPTDLLPGLANPEASDEWARAYLQLAAEYRNAQAQLATVIAEARETAQGLQANADTLAKLFNKQLDKTMSKLRHGRKSKWSLPAVIADISAGWLNWSFGIAPIINDTASLAYALAEIHETRVKVKCTGKGTSNREVRSSFTRSYFAGPFSITIRQSVRDYTRYRVKLGGLVSPSNVQYDPFSIAGMTANDVLPAAWEIVPGSWLVDYVTNVGDLIATFTAPEMAFTDSWTVLVQETGREITPSVHPSDGSNGTTYNCTLTCSPAMSTVKTFSWSRNPGHGAPIDMARFTWKNPFSSLAKSVNMTAVALARSCSAANGESQRLVTNWSRGR